MEFDPKAHALALTEALAARDDRAPAPLRALRADSRARLRALAWPTARDEAWRYTSLKPLEAAGFTPAPAGEALTVADSNLLEAARYRDFAGCELVFIDGHYDAGRSRWSALPAGVEIANLAEAAAKGQTDLSALGGVIPPAKADFFAALNGALAADGVVIRLAKNARLAAPVHLIFLATGASRTVSAPRILVDAAESSELTVVETWIGAPGKAYFNCAVTEASLGDNAVVRHYKDNRESDAAIHLAAIAARQGRDSRFHSHSLSLGGRLTRNEIAVTQAGEGTHTELKGLYMARDGQHVDHRTLMDHALPHGTSDEYYKGILDDAATSAFTGRVLVRHGAQKTSAAQQNRNLLLSRKALANSLPQLEILADDVKCSHGSTTGRLDEKQLFYLRSRGLDAAAARDLLTYAFAGEIVETITVAPLREKLDAILLGRLPIDLRLQKEAGA